MLGFTLVASVLTGVLFGALPALTARPDLAEVMKEENARAGGGFGPRRARGVLVVSQVAFSFMLLIAAGLMLRSFWKLQQVDPGFRPENVLTARVSLNWSKYDEDGEGARVRPRSCCKARGGTRGALGRAQLLDAARPGAALQPALPDRGPAGRGGRAGRRSTFRVVSPRYFETIGQRLVRGRAFEDRDDENGTRPSPS